LAQEWHPGNMVEMAMREQYSLWTEVVLREESDKRFLLGGRGTARIN
jgi:hypothetical protein